MAACRSLFLLALLAVAATPVSAQNGKMAAVNKVISMLEELQTKVLAEGEKEAATYNEFACFCKDTSKEKTEAIKKGEDSKDSLTASIESLAEDRDDLDETIKECEEDISKAEAAMKKAEKERKETLELYEKNAADLQAALDSLAGAIKAV